MTTLVRNSRSPFLDAPSYKADTEGVIANRLSLSDDETSPFIHAYTLGDEQGLVDPQSEEFAQLLTELHDPDFEGELYEFVTKASTLYESFLSQAYGNPATIERDAERMLQDRFSPISAEIDTLLDSAANDFDHESLDRMTDDDVDKLVDSYVPSQALEPAFEGIWGWAKKKLKKAAKWAKKKAKAAAKRLLRAALRKLKRYAKRWLQKVLKYAIGKIPRRYQPLAKIVAKRLGLQKELADDEAMLASRTIPQLADLQFEFDVAFAGLLMASDESRQDQLVADFETETEQPSVDDNAALADARDTFVQRVVNLRDDEDATPIVEEFIPAVLPLVKLGIKIYGRPKLVRLLAKYIARYLRRYIGKRNAALLSRAIADAGLRLIHLETTDQEEIEAAGSTAAHMVEDIVRDVAALPDDVLSGDDEELLAGHVMEAFERAATRNLPSDILPEEQYFIRPELSELADRQKGGVWVAARLAKSRKRKRCKCKKYTRRWKTKLHPRVTGLINTWDGVPLSEHLQEHYGVSQGESVDATVHLYEALTGVRLSDITKDDINTPDVGSPIESAYAQLLPLTAEAAALLTGEPGLAGTDPGAPPPTRQETDAGDRFYYLEIPRARQRMTASRRANKLRVAIDFPTQQIRVSLYLSEPHAQQVATSLRKRIPIASAMRPIRQTLAKHLPVALSGRTNGHIKLIHSALSPKAAHGPAMRAVPESVREQLSSKLSEWVTSHLSMYLRQNAAPFIEATENAADGVSVVVTLSQPPDLLALRHLLSGRTVSLKTLDFAGDLPNADIRTFPGYQSD